MPTTAVFGAGPGLGLSVARRFAREGHAIALIALVAGDTDAAARRERVAALSPREREVDDRVQIALLGQDAA